MRVPVARLCFCQHTQVDKRGQNALELTHWPFTGREISWLRGQLLPKFQSVGKLEV
jgi:hypothetical protein